MTFARGAALPRVLTRMFTPRLVRCAVIAALLGTPSALEAQRLVGEVVRADSVTPAVRVLVEWRVGRGPVQRTATDDRGRFTIAVPDTGRLALRVLRPGFRPHVVPPRPSGRRAVDSLRIVLRDEAVQLAAMRVEEDRVCGARGEAVAWQLWEQARVALQSVVLAERDSSLQLEAVEYEADLLPDTLPMLRPATIRVVGRERTQSRAHYDSLFRFGYIRRVADTSSYFSPTLAVITDDRFAERYCFTRVFDDAHPEWVGVAFEPARRPGPGIADVVGTFWLDRDELLLREVSYTYVNAPLHHRVEGLGGELHFTRLATGHWILRDWDVRMPKLNPAARRERLAIGRWSKRRTVFRVQRGGVDLFSDSAAARLAHPPHD
jgi:hypothetical protein